MHPLTNGGDDICCEARPVGCDMLRGFESSQLWRALSLAVVSGAKLFLLHATPAIIPFRGEPVNGYLTELRTRAEAEGVNVRVD
jgi:hypothetical protein